VNRYWLFGGERYYPSGGMKDLIGSFPTLSQALSRTQTKADPDATYEYGNYIPSWDDYPVAIVWWHVWDSQTQVIVDQGRY
jgi:hypothetical protein